MATDVITELSIETLVGEMPAHGCEDQYHGLSTKHADGDEQYVDWHGHYVEVKCGAIIKYMESIKDVEDGACMVCNQPGLLRDFFKVLGPVGGAK